MFCSKCGTEALEDSRFCSNCGAPITRPAGSKESAHRHAFPIAAGAGALAIAAAVMAVLLLVVQPFGDGDEGTAVETRTGEEQDEEQDRLDATSYQGWPSPVPAGDLIVASTAKSKLSALNADDFSEVWTFPSGNEDPKLDLEAIYGNPVVFDDAVYFGTYRGDVFALYLGDGSVRWSFEADGPIIAGLAASETAIYAASDDGRLYVLDPQTGRPKAEPFDAGDGIWAAPLRTEGVVYVASINGKLYALDAETLDPVWDTPFETGQRLISDPVLADATVLVGGFDRALHAVDANTGEERWSFKGDNWFWGRPLVADGTVYAPNLDGRLYALSLETGEEHWSFKAEEPLGSAPVLDGDMLIAVDRSGNVYGMDPEAGTLQWSVPTALQKTVLADPVVFADRVLISAEGGDLFSLDPATGSFVEITQAEFSRALTISPLITGSPAAGYDVVSTSVDPAAITVFGPQDLLEGAQTIRTQPVDIAGAADDVVVTVSLALPADASVSGGASVTVTVQIEPALERRTIGVTAAAVGLDPNLIIAGSLPLVEVVLLGDAAILPAILPSDITATINLAGLGEGTHEVTVSVSAPAEALVASVSPGTVNVTLEER